jgi:1,4-dihydroxy-2-naphthoate polyprenyltransferase
VAESRPWSRRDVWVRKLLYPGHTLPTAAAPMLIAAGLAFHDGTFAAGPALLALLAGWLVQLGGVLTDNYENLVQQPEDREHPELVQALARGTLTLAELKGAILACYGLALLAGAWLACIAGPFVVAIGLLSIAASWMYSAGPLPIGRVGLADPLFFLFFGIVSVAGAYYVQAAPAHGDVLGAWFVPQALPPLAFVLGIPIGALTTNILIIDDIRDREFDAVKGKDTVAVRFGIRWSRAEFAVLLALAFLVPPALWLETDFGDGILLPLLMLPSAIRLGRSVMTLDRHEDLVPVTPRAGRLLLAYAVLLAIGVALGSG